MDVFCYSLTPTASPTPTPTPAPVGYSRFNPAPANTSLDIQFQWLSGDYKARITVLNFIREDEARQRMEEANMFNDPSEAGTEYVLVKIRFEYLIGPIADTTYAVSGVYFDVVSETGVEYDHPFIVPPEPDLAVTLYPGGSHERWEGYQVAINDAKPLITFGRNYDGTGGIWFKLY